MVLISIIDIELTSVTKVSQGQCYVNKDKANACRKLNNIATIEILLLSAQWILAIVATLDHFN